MWKKARLGRTREIVVAIVFVALASIGFYGSADNRSAIDDDATRLANQFSQQLAESLRNNDQFRDAIAEDSSCAIELAALIVAQFALDQAQAEYDIAYQALEDCILALPDPPETDPDPDSDPMPDPATPETLPTNGEFSVLVR